MAHVQLIEDNPSFIESRLGCDAQEQVGQMWSHNEDNQLTSLTDIDSGSTQRHQESLLGLLLYGAYSAVGGKDDAYDAVISMEAGEIACALHGMLLRKADAQVMGAEPDAYAVDSVVDQPGFGAALLKGDLFIFRAYHSLARCRLSLGAECVARAAEALSLAYIDLCVRRALEMSSMPDSATRRDAYLNSMSGTPGAIFRASAEIGAILGGGDEAQARTIGAVGECLGMALSIRRNMQQSNDAGAIQMAQEEVYRLCRQALDTLRDIPAGDGRTSLIMLAHMTMQSAQEQRDAGNEALAAA